MLYEATVHILMSGMQNQDEACDGVSEMLGDCPDCIIDWAYGYDSSGHVLLPCPRPDLLGPYEEGDFIKGEDQHRCPYCPAYMAMEDIYYDFGGDGIVEFRCPECGAEVHIKHIPPPPQF